MKLPPKRRWQKWIAFSPDDRRGAHDFLQTRSQRPRLRGVQLCEMPHQRVATADVRERTKENLDVMSAAIVVLVSTQQIRANDGVNPARGQVPREGQHRAGKLHFAARPRVKRDATDEAELRHAMRVPYRDGLRDPATDVVSREAGEVDSEMIEDGNQPIGVGTKIDARIRRWIAAPEAEEVEHDHPVSAGEEWHDRAPEVTGGRESMDEDDRLTRSARSSRVVVESDAAKVEEFAAHEPGEREGRGTGKSELRRRERGEGMGRNEKADARASALRVTSSA